MSLVGEKKNEKKGSPRGGFCGQSLGGGASTIITLRFDNRPIRTIKHFEGKKVDKLYMFLKWSNRSLRQ